MKMANKYKTILSYVASIGISAIATYNDIASKIVLWPVDLMLKIAPIKLTGINNSGRAVVPSMASGIVLELPFFVLGIIMTIYINSILIRAIFLQIKIVDIYKGYQESVVIKVLISAIVLAVMGLYIYGLLLGAMYNPRI